MSEYRFKAIIFDLDGTLVDSSRDIVRSMNLTLDYLHTNQISYADCVNFIGAGIRSLVERSIAWVHHRDADMKIDPDLLDKADRRYREIYADHLLDTTHPYPGVPGTLQNLSGYQMAVISNKAHIYTRKILDHFALSYFFDPVLGGDSLNQKKPEPEPLLYVAEQYQLAPSKCLMVGDSEKDIAAAKSAGMSVCAVTYGMRPKVRLEELHPDFIVDAFSDLINVLE